jgi:hypothetical protein
LAHGWPADRGVRSVPGSGTPLAPKLALRPAPFTAARHRAVIVSLGHGMGGRRLAAGEHDQKAAITAAKARRSTTSASPSYDPVRLPPMPPPGSDVEAATLAPNGSLPITRITFPACRAHYPGGSSGCACRLLPRTASRGLPLVAGGSASALSLYSRYGPPDRSAAHRRPLSRGSDPCGYPHKPLVSYRINRQLSGWNLPPLMIRAFGAHCQIQTHAAQQTTSAYSIT